MKEWRECRDCGRTLRTPESRRTGYGPVCARRRTGPTRRPRPARIPNPPDVPPGQDAIPLFYFSPTLDSL
ncbi:DUF6011 domain-containing protein [Streptomyces bottropensis]|uniref:DUF6011 domain-containing protein n=1 Tax=Streptomyces bottropensis TaxID=42235 RepID=UPI0036AE307B